MGYSTRFSNNPRCISPHLVIMLEYWITSTTGWHWVEQEERWIYITHQDIFNWFSASYGVYVPKGIGANLSAKRITRTKDWRWYNRYSKLNYGAERTWRARVIHALRQIKRNREREEQVYNMLRLCLSSPRINSKRKYTSAISKVRRRLKEVHSNGCTV